MPSPAHEDPDLASSVARGHARNVPRAEQRKRWIWWRLLTAGDRPDSARMAAGQDDRRPWLAGRHSAGEGDAAPRGSALLSGSPASWMRTMTGRHLRLYAHIVDGIRRGDRTRRGRGIHTSNERPLFIMPRPIGQTDHSTE